MTTGSWTAVSLTISVPHRGQRSGSTSQTRLISSRHVADATGRRAGVVKQADGELVWASPMWITYTGP